MATSRRRRVDCLVVDAKDELFRRTMAKNVLAAEKHRHWRNRREVSMVSLVRKQLYTSFGCCCIGQRTKQCIRRLCRLIESVVDCESKPVRHLVPLRCVTCRRISTTTMTEPQKVVGRSFPGSLHHLLAHFANSASRQDYPYGSWKKSQEAPSGWR